jgi:hypothetical protein
MPETLNLNISLQDEVDDEELDRFTRLLRDEIAELDVEDAQLAPGEQLPPGAKGDPITIGSIVVALASAGVFTALIDLVKGWAHRSEGRMVTIKAKVGEEEVELTYPEQLPPEEVAERAGAVMQLLREGKAPAAEG